MSKDPGHPKVGDLDLAFAVDEKVRWLDVAVDDAAAVEVEEARENLTAELRKRSLVGDVLPL